MKKFFVAILSLVYFTSTTGATITMHYCMGKFIGWDLSLPINNKCSNCGMQKRDQKGCCNDKHQTLKLKKDELATQINTAPGTSASYLDTQYNSSVKTYSSVNLRQSYSTHGPPGISTVKPFILNCVFRI